MKTFPFKPDLRIYRDSDLLVITFDSKCPQDAARGLRSVRIPVDYKMMSTKVEGFVTKEDADGVRMTCGKVSLVVVDKEDQEMTHLLAECCMTFEPPFQKSLPLYDRLITPPQVAFVVHQGVAEALNAALNAFLQDFDPALPIPEKVIRQEKTSLLPRFLKGREAPANDEAPLAKKLKFAAIVLGAGVLTWVLMGSILSDRTPSGKTAIAAAMSPQDIEAQVKITTETLKQMGINPGNPQEMGCLGQQ
ncbi:MAG: hypothetical protein LBE22_06825 [Azoarcus sp.]|nr:hypothetical protein [Azoarcus sp.]